VLLAVLQMQSKVLQITIHNVMLPVKGICDLQAAELQKASHKQQKQLNVEHCKYTNTAFSLTD